MFDPFRDFATAGYLRNHEAENDLDLIKVAEHELFRAKVGEAIAFLSKAKRLEYRHFLEVHKILFQGLYPWAGQDRATTTPDLAISKAGTLFAHPHAARLAVEEGLRIGQDKKKMREAPGLVMGLFAYGHPFLDGNGRTMLVVHWELCHRAGFAIDWNRTSKTDYLTELSKEIAMPSRGILDAYLLAFVTERQGHDDWASFAPDLKGLDGRHVDDVVDGSFDDLQVATKYEDFERRRGYEILPPDRKS